MKKFHIAIAAKDLEISVIEYSRRLVQELKCRHANNYYDAVRRHKHTSSHM